MKNIIEVLPLRIQFVLEWKKRSLSSVFPDISPAGKVLKPACSKVALGHGSGGRAEVGHGKEDMGASNGIRSSYHNMGCSCVCVCVLRRV